MIAADQPTIFGGHIIAGVSSAGDGMMKLFGNDRTMVERNIRKFTDEMGITSNSMHYLRVLYDRSDFTRYQTVGSLRDELDITEADGIATNTAGAPLFLPLADCTGAILLDPTNKALMISHLGRHSTGQHGAKASVEFMAEHFLTKPEDILVWLGPSPGKEAYPLFKRDQMSLHEANYKDFYDAGVKSSNIEISPIDTAKSKDYFSHSEFLKGNREEDGRFAILAQLL